MLELAKEEKSPLERNKLMAHAYEWLGQWQQALECYKEYKHASDSANSELARKQSAENSLQLEVMRAESEAKDLRLQAQQQTEHAHHVAMAAAAAVALLVIGFMAFYLHRRQRQMRTLRQAYNQLEEVTAHKERIESEVRIARDIQMSMVPRVFPQLNGVDLYASMTPAKAVGGDLYDFIVKSDSITFCVGDVSGKGIPASLFMSVAVNLFRNVAEEGFPPYYIATRMNETLAKDNEKGMFVTMFIAQVDLHTGRMDFCNCGHNPPVLINSLASTGAEAAFIDMEPNAPLGLWPDLEFEGEYIENINGLTLFAYTDGLNEAENAQQEQFGEERLVELLQQHPDLSAQATIERVSQEVTAFVGDAEQSDDLTMFCLRINT
jgi:serine phosphatase RsbU (regulator of sigma subunit)